MSITQTAPADTYIAVPETPNGCGVIVLHAWWGLTPFFRSVCDRLAQEGFVALAPDLYHGEIATTIAEAEALMPKYEPHFDIADFHRFAARLRSHELVTNPIIGTVAFSMGVYWALTMAEEADSGIGAAISFYGTRDGDYSASRSAFQFHLAEADDYEPVANVVAMQKSLAAAGKEAEVFIYPDTKHWFFESNVPSAYDTAAAQLAWERTLAFLRGHL